MAFWKGQKKLTADCCTLELELVVGAGAGAGAGVAACPVTSPSNQN
jgi:hypothetical protein